MKFHVICDVIKWHLNFIVKMLRKKRNQTENVEACWSIFCNNQNMNLSYVYIYDIASIKG